MTDRSTYHPPRRPPLSAIPLRIGLLGASKVGIHALIKPARLRSDVIIAAVAAREMPRAEEYAAQHGITQVAPDYAALIARDDIDLIYNGLPQSHHCEWTVRALESGKHVLCEKPFALNEAQARTMVNAAQRSGRFLIEAFHYRFHALMRRMEEIVQSGVLGQLRAAHAIFEATSPNVPGELRWRPELGGGAMMDTGCYTVHVLRNLIGREPQVLSAECEWRDGVDVNTSAELDFSEGLVARISCSLDTPRQLYSELRLEGERGSLYVEGFPLPQWGCKWRLETPEGIETDPPAGPPTYDAQLAHVVDVCAGRARPLTGGEDAIGNMRVIEAIFTKAGKIPFRT